SACDAAIVIPSRSSATVQARVTLVAHALCDRVEEALSSGARAVAARVEKRVTMTELVAQRARWAAQRKTVVWSNGCVDLLHPGHLHSLQAARRFGDILVVGVNSDEMVRAAKGASRPYFPLERRLATLCALDVVDYVI